MVWTGISEHEVQVMDALSVQKKDQIGLFFGLWSASGASQHGSAVPAAFGSRRTQVLVFGFDNLG